VPGRHSGIIERRQFNTSIAVQNNAGMPARHRQRTIMDHLRVLLVPFHVTSLILVAIFSVLLTVFSSVGIYGMFAQAFLQIWVLKYCYVLIEQLADGATEPPVMSTDMLSPFETRPWAQLAIIIAGTTLCLAIGGVASVVLAVILLLLLPATIAVLGFGEPFYQALNPLTLFRIIRGLGPYYLLILVSIPLYVGILRLLTRIEVWAIVLNAAFLLCQLSFFSLIGGCMYLRRHQLGSEPSRSPERTAAREEAERAKLRARMLDDVFQQVRIGKHVEATRPLAQWLRDLDGPTVVLDAQHVAAQAIGWDNVSGLNTIGSTLIRHLLRAGRPDAALAIFERLRTRSPTLTVDSPDDLRTLADYAESVGREELATSIRLETPVYHSPRR
jgi:pentatricopeptide repeat protein